MKDYHERLIERLKEQETSADRAVVLLETAHDSLVGRGIADDPDAGLACHRIGQAIQVVEGKVKACGDRLDYREHGDRWSMHYCCTLPDGHDGPHRDTTHGECPEWEAEEVDR